MDSEQAKNDISRSRILRYRRQHPVIVQNLAYSAERPCHGETGDSLTRRKIRGWSVLTRPPERHFGVTGDQGVSVSAAVLSQYFSDVTWSNFAD
jgi:hypothetical protein